MIRKNDLYKEFRENWKTMPERVTISLFRGTSDYDLAKSYNLRVLRKGVFY